MGIELYPDNMNKGEGFSQNKNRSSAPTYTVFCIHFRPQSLHPDNEGNVVLLKCWYPTSLHSVTTQKTMTLVFITMKTSNLARYYTVSKLPTKSFILTICEYLFVST
jgi:hypothetical protein